MLGQGIRGLGAAAGRSAINTVSRLPGHQALSQVIDRTAGNVKTSLETLKLNQSQIKAMSNRVRDFESNLLLAQEVARGNKDALKGVDAVRGRRVERLAEGDRLTRAEETLGVMKGRLGELKRAQGETAWDTLRGGISDPVRSFFSTSPEYGGTAGLIKRGATAAGGSFILGTAGRAITGNGGAFRDRYGNPDVAGIPFV
jgi:hypothetical protein